VSSRAPRPRFVGSLAASLGALLLAAAALPAAPVDGPPETRKDDAKDVVQGVEIADPYRWLEDQNAPETRAWIDAENAYTKQVLGNAPGREDLQKRIGELLKVDVFTTPTEKGGRYFFSRRTADRDIPVLYVRKGLHGQDEVLVDPVAIAPDHSLSASYLDVSEDGSVAVYGLRKGGEDEQVVRVIAVEGRKPLPDELPRARYSGISLSNDKKALYYSRQTPEGPRVYRHDMGTSPSSDVKLFGDGYGPEKLIGVSLSDDNRYLLLTVFHGSAAPKTEVYVQDLGSGGPIRTVVNDVDARFLPTLGGDRLYCLTNWEAANGRVLSIDLKAPARENWKEVVPQSDLAIQDIATAGGRLFVRYLDSVVPKVWIFDPAGKSLGQIAFPSIGTVSNVSGDWDKKEAFFTYQSYLVPSTIYRYDVGAGARSVFAQNRVPIASDRYEVEQVRYPSKDGTQIPMFLVHRKGLSKDGSNPALLTGYGGFTLSSTPSYSATAALWVERGGVYAVANLRGGGEFGEAWHKAGMLEKKQNVFDDFLSAAEWLTAQKWTSRDKLAIIGASNGGLLVGAALTQRPELFRAVVCSYPLLDMVRYHKFFVAGFWVPEYGSSENPEQFQYLYTYSPYHRVKSGTAYPAVLFVTGDSDTRVAPLHARKMTALLQTDSADQAERPVLLSYDTRAGHSRGFTTPVSQQIEDLSNQMLFLTWQLGMAAPEPAAKPAKKAA
jgi:prolyl oligopeptidase